MDAFLSSSFLLNDEKKHPVLYFIVQAPRFRSGRFREMKGL